MTVQLLALYIESERHNAQRYRQTDRQTSLWCQCSTVRLAKNRANIWIIYNVMIFVCLLFMDHPVCGAVMYLEKKLQLQTTGSKVRSFWQWAAATCAAPPSVIAGQYATSHNCKPLLIMFM